MQISEFEPSEEFKRWQSPEINAVMSAFNDGKWAAIPKETIPLIASKLRTIPRFPKIGVQPAENELFGLLAYMLKRFEDDLPSDVKGEAIQVLIERMGKSRDGAIAAFTTDIDGLEDPRLIAGLERLSTGPDPAIRIAVSRLLAKRAEKAAATRDEERESGVPKPHEAASSYPDATPASRNSPSTPVGLTSKASSSEPSTPSLALLCGGAAVSLALLAGLAWLWKRHP